MPIYEYRCLECNHQEEHLQKVSEPPLTVCPSCGKPSYKKLLSAAGFQLKGSGWYATDFRNKGSKPADGKDAKKADSKTESKPDSGTKTDSKPDAKPESKSASTSTVTAD
ncbi:MAG TPA: zinc ribbon domain-containing protein [Burkholderiales bacterium]|jgi:putative FmdB family regulatory protein|nr:zinc ribbon domain-containing protein [Burkholderiales bacterium]